jgi:hypothetical protein
MATTAIRAGVHTIATVVKVKKAMRQGGHWTTHGGG